MFDFGKTPASQLPSMPRPGSTKLSARELNMVDMDARDHLLVGACVDVLHCDDV